LHINYFGLKMAVYLPSLKATGKLDDVHITICNVGSRKVNPEDSYSSGAWKNFIPNLTVYGFDADLDACTQANSELESQQIQWVEQHIPLAIAGSVGEATLHVTQNPMCSSLYSPNESFLSRFRELPELVNLDFSIDIETITLDEACRIEEIQEVDFLQIDVQGADLQVLEGASSLLSRSVLAIEVEVEFSPLYIDQPLFSDVDTYLRKQDFSLFDLILSHRTRSVSPIYSASRRGQLLWGEAFYFRDLLSKNFKSPLQTPKQTLKLACLADALQFPDYALELLHHLTLNYGNDDQFNFADNIVEVLSQFPELMDQGLNSLPVIASIKQYLK
jgi:FkbM family methyltransferase